MFRSRAHGRARRRASCDCVADGERVDARGRCDRRAWFVWGAYLGFAPTRRLGPDAGRVRRARRGRTRDRHPDSPYRRPRRLMRASFLVVTSHTMLRLELRARWPLDRDTALSSRRGSHSSAAAVCLSTCTGLSSTSPRTTSTLPSSGRRWRSPSSIPDVEPALLSASRDTARCISSSWPRPRFRSPRRGEIVGQCGLPTIRVDRHPLDLWSSGGPPTGPQGYARNCDLRDRPSCVLRCSRPSPISVRDLRLTLYPARAPANQ